MTVREGEIAYSLWRVEVDRIDDCDGLGSWVCDWSGHGVADCHDCNGCDDVLELHLDGDDLFAKLVARRAEEMIRLSGDEVLLWCC